MKYLLIGTDAGAEFDGWRQRVDGAGTGLGGAFSGSAKLPNSGC